MGLRVSIQARRELLASVAPRYACASPEEKETLLDTFTAATGYHRKYAIALLNHPPAARKRPAKRPRARRYDAAVQQALVQVWNAANHICAKRLVPFLPELVEALERHGALVIDAKTRRLLLSLSPATADRLLQSERRKSQRRGLSTTKPGTLLKQQIPVRTFADWDDARTGFMEVDLVAHCGETTRGEYLHSLVLTDIATGWTECWP